MCHAGQTGLDFTVLQIIKCVGVICQNHSRVREGMAAPSIFCWERCRQPFLVPGANAHLPPSPELCDSFVIDYPASFEEKGPNFGHFAAILSCLKTFILFLRT